MKYAGQSRRARLDASAVFDEEGVQVGFRRGEAPSASAPHGAPAHQPKGIGPPAQPPSHGRRFPRGKNKKSGGKGFDEPKPLPANSVIFAPDHGQKDGVSG
jgi:hypothetical protein